MLFLEGCHSVVARRVPFLSWNAESWIRVGQRLKASHTYRRLGGAGSRVGELFRCVAFPETSVILRDLLFFPLVTSVSPSLSSERGSMEIEVEAEGRS